MDRFTDKPNKRLGQHWLDDEATIRAICDAAELTGDDTVLEIGPGQGSLTRHLIKRAKKVVAVEIDPQLTAKQRGAPNLEVIEADILKFDLAKLPTVYKVVANIPYYLTSNLLRKLAESVNPPQMMVLLVQKEVAERIAAGPGQMSLLAVSVQLYYHVKLGRVVSAELFQPPPKVDSQVIILRRHSLSPIGYDPMDGEFDSQKFFQLVKAGFSERRKKLRSSLAGGLGLSKEQAEDILKQAGVSSDSRAQELSLEQWFKISEYFQ